jgi:hypothetical protein
MMPTIAVTGFWMRNDIEGLIEVLVRHNEQWIVVFDKDGPGPTARDSDQIIDHMIHAGGVQNLIDYGDVHGRVRVAPVRGRRPGTSERVWTVRTVPAQPGPQAKTKMAPIRGRRPGKPDRRAVERRADKRRIDDKRKARLKR